MVYLLAVDFMIRIVLVMPETESEIKVVGKEDELSVFSVRALQSGWRTHTYPEVLFRVTSYLMEGHSCLPDKPPMDRQLDFNSVSNLYSDAEQASQLLAPLIPYLSTLTDLSYAGPRLHCVMYHHIGTTDKSANICKAGRVFAVLFLEKPVHGISCFLS